MVNKRKRYFELLEEFKNLKNFPDKLYNPFDLGTGYNKYNKINAWEIWHGDLSPETLIIGQDSTSKDKFVEMFTNGNEKDSPPDDTEITLRNLYNSLNRGDIRFFNQKQKLPVFLTNAVWGIKDAEKSGSIKPSWYKHTSHLFKKLIDLLEPCNIICLGSIPYRAIRHIYPEVINFKYAKDSIKNNGEYEKIKVGNKEANLFVVAHCSPLGLANRKFKIQKQDWLDLKEFMCFRR